MDITITALPTEIARRMREQLSPVLQTENGAPCRHCLRRAQAGESVVLGSYSPFQIENPYKETGPIFVHAHECERYERGAGYPDEFRKPVSLRAYSWAQEIVRGEAVLDDSIESRVRTLLAEPKVAYLHARSFSHGCYLFRVDSA